MDPLRSEYSADPADHGTHESEGVDNTLRRLSCQRRPTKKLKDASNTRLRNAMGLMMRTFFDDTLSSPYSYNTIKNSYLYAKPKTPTQRLYNPFDIINMNADGKMNETHTLSFFA